jgi:hypothetical protein
MHCPLEQTTLKPNGSELKKEIGENTFSGPLATKMHFKESQQTTKM